MKEFNQISCVFCGAKAVDTDKKCMECGGPLAVGALLVGCRVDGYLLVEYRARGFYGLTFRVEDRFGGRALAMKLISKAAYEKYGKDFVAEVSMHAKLERTPTIVQYIGAGETTLTVDGGAADFYYILSDWIEGLPLSQFLAATHLSGEHLIMAARDFLSALCTLFDANLWHNDLHDENILVRTLTVNERRSYRRSIGDLFVVIDIGSMVHRNPGDVKCWDDLVNVGNHLARLASALRNRFEILTKEDQYFLCAVEVLLARFTDENPSRRFHSPTDALQAIEDLYVNSRRQTSPEIRSLEDPFGYINANDIPSNWLLKHLFSEQFAYFREVRSRSQQSLLITGPRGSGKTMLLKNLRFLTLYESREQEPDSFLATLTSVGLFFSARTNFGNYLVSYRNQKWIESEELILLYFNILITVELLDVLYRLEEDQMVSNANLAHILQHCESEFETGPLTLHTAKEHLLRIARSIINDRPVHVTVHNSTPAYLDSLLGLVRTSVDVLHGKDIIVLVDDLTLPRVPAEVQRALIPALFNTGASYKTRVTAHSEGLVLQDAGGETYTQNRDLREINLGYAYWQLSDNYQEARCGFDDILEKRFRLAGRLEYCGLEGMLGTDLDLEEMGRKIRELAIAKKLRSLKYYGSQVMVKLCSGDLSYLVDMLGKMHAQSVTSYPISNRVQNSVVRNYARTELRRLQDVRASADLSLYDVAYAFGVLSKSKLMTDSGEYLRIEVPIDGLSSFAYEAVRDLLCHGVFIDGGFGNMSDGVPARRLLFRRIYTPAFPTTFNNRNTFPMRGRTFSEFISKPTNFIRRKMSEDRISPDDQQALEQLELLELE